MPRKQSKQEKKINKVVNKALRTKGLIPENKFVTTPISDTTMDQLGVQNSLCLVADGENFYERSGMQIAVSKIEIDVFIFMGANELDTQNWENPLIALLIDKQSNGAFPIEIFSEGNASLLASDAPFIVQSGTAGTSGKTLYFRNPLMAQRYRYLMDTTSLIHGEDWEYLSTTPKYNNIAIKKLRYTKTFKTPVIVQYDDVTATSDCIVKNNFILMVLPVSDDKLGYSAFSKLTYTDV